MPCNDITDALKVELDQNDRLVRYQLSKRTCGAEVGDRSLLLELFRGKACVELLNFEPEELLAARPARDETEEFLLLKHLFALQNSLKAFSGTAPCGDHDPCTIDGVEEGPEGVAFRASLKVDLLAEQVKACAGCGCASRKVRKTPSKIPAKSV